MTKQEFLKRLKRFPLVFGAMIEGICKGFLYIVIIFGHMMLLREIIEMLQQATNYNEENARVIVWVFFISMLYVTYRMFIRDVVKLVIERIKTKKEAKNGGNKTGNIA